MSMSGMSGPLGDGEVVEQILEDKQTEYQAEAEEAHEARLAGYKSRVRRLIEFLLPGTRRHDDDLPGEDAADDDPSRPGQIRGL
jgi:hypothetical protein